MKKNYYLLIPSRDKKGGGSKLFRVMKTTLFLVLVTISQVFATGTYSQNSRINLDLRNTTIKNVLANIESESEFLFMYDATKINVAQKVNILANNKLITEVLDELFLSKGISYSINNRIIALKASSSMSKQQKMISGKVTDDTGEPLPGVAIVIKGTNKGTVTDVDGNYSINVNRGEVLTFSFIGMKSQEITVGSQSSINISMLNSSIGIDEVIAIGYGTQKKSDLTGAVVRMDAENFKNQPMTQLSDMLTGTIAGFYAIQGTTAAGGSSLEIRGSKSLNASTDPMIVIDGSIYNGSISDINPSDIKTIDVLKDASSSAVYGSRAAEGVILITTKKGNTGKPTINFSANVGVANPTNGFKPYDGAGYQSFRADYLRSVNPSFSSYYYDNPDKLSSNVTLDEWREASNNPQSDNTNEYLGRLGFYQVEIDNYKAGKEINWYDQVTHSGIRQNYDLSVSGSSDRVNYYWSIGYQNNEGVVVGDKFSTIRSRLNLDLKITDWLNVGVNSQFSDRDQSSIKVPLYLMYYNSPYGSMYNEDGSINWYPNSFNTMNPLIDYYGQDRLMKETGLFASIYANIKLPYGIEYKISYQPRYSFAKDYNFWPSTTIQGGVDHSQGYGTRKDASSFGWILDHLVHWKKEFGIHNLDLTLLYSSEENKSWSSTMLNESFVPNENLSFNGLQFGKKPNIDVYDQRITGDAAMARLNYELLDKYLITLSIRRDGYSAFGVKNPRAIFPSAAFAWKISKEEFFKVDWISQLKARVSWGVNGNRSIGAYSALAQISPNFYYDGTNLQVGVFNSTLANSDLVWERTKSLNFGLDVGLFKNRVTMVAEYYNSTTNDLLMKRMLPVITGFADITTNLGELANKGFEFTMNTVNINNSNFSWKSSFVFSLNRNKIKKLFGDYEEVIVGDKTVSQEMPDYTNEWFPGQALDRVWNYKVNGIWQLDEASEAEKYGLTPGDFKAEDVDGNYAYEALVDKQFIGYTKPRYNLGFKNDFTFLKNFTASIFIRADLGHIGEFNEALRNSSEIYDKRNVYDIPYWTPENPINDYAKLSTQVNAFGGGLKVYKKLSFIRLQDISLSYQLPDLSRIIKVNSIRVYGSVRNLITIDNWPGWDPESIDTPMPMITTIGVNISL